MRRSSGGKRVGGEHDALGPHAGRPASTASTPSAGVVQRASPATCSCSRTPSSTRRARSPQPGGPGSTSARAGPLPDAAQVGGRVDLRAHRVPVEPVAVVAVLPHHRRELAQLLDLVLAAGAPGSTRSAPSRSRCRAARSPARCPSRFSRPSRSSWSISSGKRLRPLGRPWVSDASVKPPLRPLAPAADRRRLQHHDVAGRVVLLGLQRRPQAREAAADHGQRAAVLARERVGRGRGERRVQPEGAWLRLHPGGAAHEAGNRIW